MCQDVGTWYRYVLFQESEIRTEGEARRQGRKRHIYGVPRRLFVASVAAEMVIPRGV